MSARRHAFHCGILRQPPTALYTECFWSHRRRERSTESSVAQKEYVIVITRASTLRVLRVLCILRILYPVFKWNVVKLQCQVSVLPPVRSIASLG